MRRIQALLVLSVILFGSTCAQCKARPADFKVKLGLLPTALKDESDGELQSLFQRARSGDLGLVQGAQLLVPLLSITEYKRSSQKINLTADCLVIGPDRKTGFDHPNCGSANESNFKPPNTVTIRHHEVLILKESDPPGIYMFRVVVTDHVRRTSAAAEQRFTYAPSDAGQTVSSATALPAPASAAKTAPPGFTPGTETLDGLYAGHLKQNDILANWYLFKPSGAVAIDCHQALFDPDEALSWPTRINQHRSSVNFVAEDDKSRLERQGYQFFDCVLGKYRLSGNRIQIFAQRLFVDSTHRLTIRDNLFDYGDKKGEAETFRFVDGSKQIEIGEQSLLRQVDQTGRKLSGTFGHFGGGLSTQYGKASFRPDGQFSMEEDSDWHGPGAVARFYRPGSASEEKGRYEIRGNEIIFHNPDGTTSKKLFGVLEKDEHGRERVAIGDGIWTKGYWGKLGQY